MVHFLKIGKSQGYGFLNKILSNLEFVSIVLYLNLGFSRKFKVHSAFVFFNSAYDNAKSYQHSFDSL